MNVRGADRLKFFRQLRHAHVLESNRDLHPFERAIVRFLLSREGEQIKYQVGSRYHGLIEAEAVDQNLRRMLGETPPTENRGDASNESWYDWIVESSKPVRSYLFGWYETTTEKNQDRDHTLEEKGDDEK